MTHPEFVDNLDGNTLERALRERLEHLFGTLQEPPSISIATGYFNPQGFGRLADLLCRTARVRLLLGAEPLPAARYPERRLGEPRGERFEAQLTHRILDESEGRLKRDRDRLPFSSRARDAVRELLAFLESGRIEVRRYERRFLHGKAFVFSGKHGVLAGSSNFTLAGLTSNLELNLGQYQPHVLERVEQWFDRLWDEAVPYDLAPIYRARFAEYRPYLIYLRVLWERYKDELEEEADETGRIRLTRFQTDGVFRAKRILERYHGVLVADSVGLGKSFVAADLFTEVIERNRQRALLIAPAQLRDGMWAQFRKRYQSGVEVVSFEQVADDGQLGEGEGSALSADVDDYSLIVIDEAHAFRNPNTKRARALRRLLRGDPPKKVVMLTATPVNNSLWDLYDLLSYFIGHDAVFADRGIPSLKKRFQVAAAEDPFTLRPDVLFDILDATTVRRTRHHVQRFYPNDHFQLPDGTQVTIQFPDPVVEARSYDLEDVLPGFFEEFTEILAADDGHARLTMARYWPTRYRRHGRPEQREAALVGLIRSGLLKRFESSARAFERTLSRMVDAHDHFARAVDQGVIPSSDSLTQLQDTDSDEAWDELLAEGEPIDDEDIDVERLLEDVRSDRELLQRLQLRAATVSPESDPKLELLVRELARIAAEADRLGISEHDRRNRRKVIVFSYFADTVEWIAEHLESVLQTDRRLAAYRKRMAVVRGTESYEGVTRSDAVFGFVPESSDAPPARSEDLYDILITTDVLAEGMNLQQAGRIINYDLPWNPMRLVQRHGRIDRIGSPHEKVFLTCVFPDRQLEALLALEDRIRRKLAQAAASIGLDQIVIPDVETTDQVFGEREEIERLRREDPAIFERGGEDVHAHSGEEYRQELRKGLERWEDQIKDLPWGVGSGFVGGTRTGYVFCARVFDRVFMRFVPVADEEETVIERDALTCLGILSCTENTERVLPEDFAEGAYDAWERAREDIFQEWQAATDPANLQPEVRPLFRAAADHVRMHPAEGLTVEDRNRLADALEAPWGIRYEKRLREVFTPETADGASTTLAIAGVVKELGLQPFRAPKPLDPIEPDEIDLVVWMGVQREQGRAPGTGDPNATRKGRPFGTEGRVDDGQ